MADMTLPWAPVATLINSPPARRRRPWPTPPESLLSAAGMQDHGSSGKGGPRTSRAAAAPTRGL